MPRTAIGALLKRLRRRRLRDSDAGPDGAGSPRPAAARTLQHVRGGTPWRDHAYDVAVDLRVNTTFQQRQRHIGRRRPPPSRALHALRGDGRLPIAVFFPSFAYAEAVRPRRSDEPAPRCSRGRATFRPRTAWIGKTLDGGRALFLVLGSGFAEGIDLLGRPRGPRHGGRARRCPR
jgi:DNA excision repair protein ERCC-2